jgi:hypothetical protein
MNDDHLGQELTAMSNAIKPTAEAPAVLHEAVGRRARRNRVAVGTVAATACLAVAAGAVWIAAPTGKPTTSAGAAAASTTPSKDPVIFAEALEQFASSTAEDWVSVADRVVVGTVTTEKETTPTPAEVGRGEGLTGRAVSISVERSVWSRAGVPAIPAKITLNAVGSTFNGGVNNDRHRLAYHDASRLEVGHRYVFALRYAPATCEAGESTPARWAGIGSGGVIPFDTATLGTGEIEGSAKAVVPNAEAGRGVLRAQLRGKSLTDLPARLGAAKGRARVSETAALC